MQISKRVKAGIALVLCLAVAGSAAAAQEFPGQSFTMILSSGSGSSVDVMGRTLASVVEDELGQTVVVENRPGGDGAIAMTDLLGAEADGYTWWAATKTFPVAMSTTLSQFNMDDFQPLVRVQVDPFALAVRGDSEFETLQDLIDAGKERQISVGGFGSASPHGLFNFRLADATGANLTWIPFGAGSQAVTALLGGHVDAVVSNPSSMISQVEAGALRILAVATEERAEDLPDTPTFIESGVDLVDAQWRGLFTRAGTPDDVMEALDTALEAAIRSDEFQDYLERTLQKDGYMGPAEFAEFIAREMEGVERFAEPFLASLEE